MCLQQLRVAGCLGTQRVRVRLGYSSCKLCVQLSEWMKTSVTTLGVCAQRCMRICQQLIKNERIRAVIRALCDPCILATICRDSPVDTSPLPPVGSPSNCFNAMPDLHITSCNQCAEYRLLQPQLPIRLALSNIDMSVNCTMQNNKACACNMWAVPFRWHHYLL